MGLGSRKARLPTPTDSPIEQTPLESGADLDLATDISRRTDKTSYTVPEDGREITIPAKRRLSKRSKAKEELDSSLSSGTQQSQTSFLIEYFEGVKDAKFNSGPSVRVKVTPSAAQKIRESNNRVKLSEATTTRKPSSSKRILLPSPESQEQAHMIEAEDDKSISSYTSAAEESSLAPRYPPMDSEIMRPGEPSDLSKFTDLDDRRLIHQNPSDISSMPPDSMLEEKSGVSTPPKRSSRSSSRDVTVAGKDTLKTPLRRDRSLSKERIARKVAEKLSSRPKESSGGSSGKHRRSSKSSRSRSVSAEHLETLKSPRRRSSRHHEDDVRSPTESSVVTDSYLSHKSHPADQHSVRSGASKSSISAHPRLLETVENAIKRLIIPELETIKKEQSMQKARRKFESTTSLSEDGVSRKLSKHSSAPDVINKPKLVLNRDSKHSGTLLSGDSVKDKERRRSRKSDSPRERRLEREISEDTVIHDGGSASKKRSKDGHKLRDAAIVGGALTAAALSHHDMKHRESRSSVDGRERRRRRRSKSHSRSASRTTGADETLQLQDAPPMPLQSDIHSSDITRDSILSDETERTKSPSFEVQKAIVRQLARASPREISSTGTKSHAKTQLKSTEATGKETGTKSGLKTRFGEAAAAGLGAGAAATAAKRLSTRNMGHYAQDEDDSALSPAQSVSSHHESETDQAATHRRAKFQDQNSVSDLSAADVAFDHADRPKGIHLEATEDVLDQHGLRPDDVEEWLQREHEKNDQYRSSLGEDSLLESAGDLKRMTNFTNESMDGHHLDGVIEGQRHHSVEARKNPEYQTTPIGVESAVASLLDTSVISSRSKPADSSYLDSLERDQLRDSAYSASQEVNLREFDPSRGRAHLNENGRPLTAGSPRQSFTRSADGSSEHIRMGASGLPVADDPIPEIGHGLSESDISTNPSIIQGPMAGTPTGNRDHWPYQPTPPQQKELLPAESKPSSAHESLKAAAAGILAAARAASAEKLSLGEGKPRSREWSVEEEDYEPRVEDAYDEEPKMEGGIRDSYITNPSNERVEGDPRDPYMANPSPLPDEGYVSGPVKGIASPEVSFREAKSWNDGGLDLVEDPFVGPQGHTRHLSTNSGLARGIGSPLYDSATGNGLDHIQSKDIVALMDHLTVRDAQRNARDTEILVTLVRSAAEMRNSFEEMKRFISEQDDILVEHGNRQHDRTIQKLALGGPRPQPAAGPAKAPRRTGSEEDEDQATKRRNVFRRALRGLSSRNHNEIGKIEEMLEQLLGEVEGLRAAQVTKPSSGQRQGPSENLDTYQTMRATDPYSAKASAQKRSGGSPGGNSGHLSTPPSRGPSAMKVFGGSANRVSTVLEAEEEPDEHDRLRFNDQYADEDRARTPTRENPRPDLGVSLTPPQVQLAAAASKSAEHTPKENGDKGRKHRSSTSSILPKVSRWSRTTASSVGDTIRNSAGLRKDRPLSEASRSGELQQYDDADLYDPQGDDRLRSNTSLANEQAGDALVENRPPSPLIPSHVSTEPGAEDPKYQAHRDSLNLQHPQPRPGPTHRYQHRLESSAQNLDFKSNSPAGDNGLSPTSDSFGSDPALSRFMPGTMGVRYSAGLGAPGHLSPISSEGGYSDKSAAQEAQRTPPPPRPPKIKDEGPLIPSTAAKAGKDKERDPTKPTIASPLGRDPRDSTVSASEEVYKRTESPNPNVAARPAVNARPLAARKPTGPRPITSSGGSNSWKSRSASGADGNGGTIVEGGVF